MDLAKQQCATRLQEGLGLFPSLQVTSSVNSSNQGEMVKADWALKEMKKAYRFNEKQKTYLEARFNIGHTTGRKLEPDVVAKEMRRARGSAGERLFWFRVPRTPANVVLLLAPCSEAAPATC